MQQRKQIGINAYIEHTTQTGDVIYLDNDYLVIDYDNNYYVINYLKKVDKLLDNQFYDFDTLEDVQIWETGDTFDVFHSVQEFKLLGIYKDITQTTVNKITNNIRGQRGTFTR